MISFPCSLKYSDTEQMGYMTHLVYEGNFLHCQTILVDDNEIKETLTLIKGFTDFRDFIAIPSLGISFFITDQKKQFTAVNSDNIFPHKQLTPFAAASLQALQQVLDDKRDEDDGSGNRVNFGNCTIPLNDYNYDYLADDNPGYLPF